MNEVELREDVVSRRRAPRPKAAGRDGVAVLVPCFNEEAAIGKVVRNVRRALPDATVYVYDNNSTDDTIRVARAAGAIVRTERRRGKGNVVRRMFADIDADAYVLLDGDATYDVASAPAMISSWSRSGLIWLSDAAFMPLGMPIDRDTALAMRC
jgi:glycosyltransferase involved in cell wall biosynthesis